METEHTADVVIVADAAHTPVGEAAERAAAERLRSTFERVGARYLDDLLTLNEEFRRFYEGQLAAKDERIAELTRRLDAAERAGSEAEARTRELQASVDHYVATMRAVYEGLTRDLDSTGPGVPPESSRAGGAAGDG
jgi:hypothetical protein